MQDRIGRACTSFLKNALLDFHTLTLLWELLCVLQLFPDSTLLEGLWTEAQEKGSSLPPANIVSAGVSNMEPFNNKPSFPHWRTLSGLFFVSGSNASWQLSQNLSVLHLQIYF